MMDQLVDPIEDAQGALRDEDHDVPTPWSPSGPRQISGIHGQERSLSENTIPTKARRITLDELAGHLRAQRMQEARVAQLYHQKESLSKQIAIGSRLARLQRRVRRALVKQLRAPDHDGFADCFNRLQNLKESCMTAWMEDNEYSDTAKAENYDATLSERGLLSPEKLTLRSRNEILELLRIVRTEPTSLSERLKSLSFGQLSRLIETPDKPDRPDSLPSSSSHSRNTMSTLRRNLAFKTSVKNQINSLEKNDPLAILLHNVYTTNHGPDSSEAGRRLHMWSTICANLFSPSNEDFHPILQRVLNEYADLSEWRARPRLELFLRDVLQKGAFLLGHSRVEASVTTLNPEAEASLRTEEAERFFGQALIDLFVALDDMEGGLPRGSLELTSAILGKMDENVQREFRGFLVYTWFFCDHLDSFLVEPESHGALLDHHIPEEARDRIFRQISSRAQSLVYDMFDSQFQPSPLSEAIWPHVKRMINQLTTIEPSELLSPIPSATEDDPFLHEGFSVPPLMLAPADLITLIDTLYPRTTLFSNLSDPFTLTNSAVLPQNNPTAHITPASGTTYGSMYLYDNIPIHAKARRSGSPRHSDAWERLVPGTRPTTGAKRYELLRRDLEKLSDLAMATPPRAQHDGWIAFEILQDGQLTFAALNQSVQAANDRPLTSLDWQRTGVSGRRKNVTEEAAIKLAGEFYSAHGSTASSVGYDRFHRTPRPLDILFEEQVDLCRAKSDSATAHYWWVAFKHVRENYPLACLSENDTKILAPLVAESQEIRDRESSQIMVLESQIDHFQAAASQIRATLEELSGQLDNFRDKMWYLAGVRDSKPFELARNITIALNNMSLPDHSRLTTEPSVRGQLRAMPSIGSLLQQKEIQTVDLLKAPVEHGGPKKLADDQIDRTRKWMSSYNIDNFCPGEERIHRFCFEIKETVNKLVGDNMLDGRVLWTSDLFARERTKFDISSSRPASGQIVTRPSSVISDDGPPFPYPYFRGQDSLPRTLVPETSTSPGRKSSFHSFDRSRSGRDTYTFDTASASDSPGRTISTVTSDSLGTFWSPAVTQAQSATSIYSTHSRPPSMHNDLGSKGLEAGQQARSEFLQKLKDNLVSLLLSDLCCPVWSTGCETDAWVSSVLGEQRIRQRLEKRAGIADLLSHSMKPGRSSRTTAPRLRSRRSLSVESNSPRGQRLSMLSSLRAQDGSGSQFQYSSGSGRHEPFSFSKAFADMVQRFSAEANPRNKLQVLRDLCSLLLASINDVEERQQSERPRGQSRSRYHARRLSQPTPSRSDQHFLHEDSTREETQNSEPSMSSNTSQLTSQETKAVDRLKRVLMEIQPRTLFRDLQLVSAFVSTDVLADPENAKALLLTGLAALAFKDDICRTMVGIADKVVSQDLIKRRIAKQSRNDFSLEDALEYWMICAKEGNAIAQRELALLYLTHSSILPKVTSPMSLSREAFHPSSHVSIRGAPDLPDDSPAMQLALHWMEMAAKNGDQLAQDRLHYVGQPA